jgi:hypothetical protein
MPRFICRNCGQTTSTSSSFPMSNTGCPKSKTRSHAWKEKIFTEKTIAYRCKWCNMRINTRCKTDWEIKTCSKNPMPYKRHVFIKG